MGFADKLKDDVKRKSNFTCCWCRNPQFKVEIHHIMPQADGGEDTEENAAPLCPNCHTMYGDNPQLRKEIRLRRDHWYSGVQTLHPNLDYAHQHERAKPLLTPLYKRLLFLDEVEKDTDTDDLREKCDDLVKFVKTWDKGGYYSERIQSLTAFPVSKRKIRMVHVNDLSNPAWKRREQEHREQKYRASQVSYRQMLIDNRPKINELISELLLYQDWYTGEMEREL